MSVATALAALKARFQTECASLTDTRLNLECTVAIERWYAAAVMLATEEASAISSYAVEGVSVTKRPLSGSGGNLAQTVEQLRAQVEAFLYGGAVRLADARGSE